MNADTTIPPSRSAAMHNRLSQYLSRFREGPIVVLFAVALVSVAAFGVQKGGWSNLVVPVGITGTAGALLGVVLSRSEERRVGKECRLRLGRDRRKKKHQRPYQ